MNLQTHIKPELWAAISNTYEGDNFTHAILDAMHYLSDVLREKSGAEGDGTNLVGQALGGDSPKLRVNKLQTETEKNVQKGLVQILIGMYSAICNPRSHEQIVDDQNTADAIIYFVNYVLGILDQSHEPFTIEDFLLRVDDPYFVEGKDYAELLIADIPPKKLLDTLIEIYRSKTMANGEKLSYIIQSILKKLSENQVNDFVSIVSDELKLLQNQIMIRTILQILPPELWPKINDAVKVRIENKLISLIKNGELFSNGECNTDGVLGTWAMDFLEYFSLKRPSLVAIITSFESENENKRRYVTEYCLTRLPKITTSNYEISRCIHSISKAIKNRDEVVMGNLSLYSFPDGWREEFKALLEGVTNDDGEPYFTNDPIGDIPF